MNIVTRLVNDPFLYGECLLGPTKQIVNQLSNNPRPLDGVFNTAYTIYTVAIGILTLPLALIGCLIKSYSMLFGTNFYTRPLSVKKFSIDSTKSTQISSIVQEWKAIAQKKEHICMDPHFKEVFTDSGHMLTLISKSLNDRNKTNIQDTVFICRDTILKQPQAIALTREAEVYKHSGVSFGRYIKVDLLASNPINIRSDVNEMEYTRVYGASKAIFARLARLCVKKELDGIYLESIDTAYPFYKKLGFKKLKKEKIQTTWAPQKIIPMRLKKKYFEKYLLSESLR